MTLNPLSANPTKRPNTLKQFAGKLLTNCLSVFDHFVKLALKGLITVSLYLDVHAMYLWSSCPQIFYKIVTLKILQNSHENAFNWVSF